MKNILFPNVILNNIYEIDIEKLKINNINLLIFDIDNTLVSYSVPNSTERIDDFFDTLRANGFKVALLSNNNQQRVETFNKQIKAYHVFNGAKPLKRGFARILNHFNEKPENTAIIGDQIFTDVLGGNRMNIFTVMVNPIELKENFFFKFKRKLEEIIIRDFNNSKK